MEPFIFECRYQQQCDFRLIREEVKRKTIRCLKSPINDHIERFLWFISRVSVPWGSIPGLIAKRIKTAEIKLHRFHSQVKGWL